MSALITSREDLEALLRSKQEGFSPAFRRVAAFLLSEYQRACFMTASELARAAGVSQPSVTRFVGYLGFEGYAQFQRSLQAIVRGEMRGPARLRAIAEAREAEGPYAWVVREEIANLERLLPSLGSPSFQAVASALADADAVVVAGFRASIALAEYMGFFLGKVHPGVHVLTRADSRSLERLIHLDPARTGVVLFAFPRYPSEALDFQQFATRRGFATSVITDTPFSPLVRLAQHSLVAPVAFGSLFDSYCAPMVLCNALIQEVAARHPERTEQMLRRFEEMAEERRLFAAT